MVCLCTRFLPEAAWCGSLWDPSLSFACWLLPGWRVLSYFSELTQCWVMFPSAILPSTTSVKIQQTAGSSSPSKHTSFPCRCLPRFLLIMVYISIKLRFCFPGLLFCPLSQQGRAPTSWLCTKKGVGKIVENWPGNYWFTLCLVI